MTSNIRKLLTSSLFSGLLVSAQAAPYIFKSESANGSVSFLAIGKPSFLKIEGKGKGPEGEVRIEGNKISGDFKFELATLDTGIEKRDEHMKDNYLKVNENPTTTLKLENLELAEAFDVRKSNLKAEKLEGQLTLNGVTKAISGEWKAKADDSKQKVTSNFVVKLSDFNIEIPSFAGITVADEVKVRIKTELAPSSAPLDR